MGEGAITILVAESDFELIESKVGSEFNVKSDNNMVPGTAELQSTALTAKINLNQHLEQLIEAFVVPINDETQISNKTISNTELELNP